MNNKNEFKAEKMEERLETSFFHWWGNDYIKEIPSPHIPLYV